MDGHFLTHPAAASQQAGSSGSQQQQRQMATLLQQQQQQQKVALAEKNAALAAAAAVRAAQHAAAVQMHHLAQEPVTAPPTHTSSIEDKVLAILHEWHARGEHLSNGGHLAKLFQSKHKTALKPPAGFKFRAWLESIQGVKVYSDKSCWYPMLLMKQWSTSQPMVGYGGSRHSVLQVGVR